MTANYLVLLGFPEPHIEALIQGLLSEAGSSELVSIYSWTGLESPLGLGVRCAEN
jgi:hypothetical protein